MIKQFFLTVLSALRRQGAALFQRWEESDCPVMRGLRPLFLGKAEPEDRRYIRARTRKLSFFVHVFEVRKFSLPELPFYRSAVRAPPKYA